MRSMSRRRRWRPGSPPGRSRPCASTPERANQIGHGIPIMNFRLPATALCAVALPVLSLISGPASAETRDFAAIARTAGKPKIPDLDVVWMVPWGDRARAHRWENIIVHQTETQPGTAKILAEKQN